MMHTFTQRLKSFAVTGVLVLCLWPIITFIATGFDSQPSEVVLSFRHLRLLVQSAILAGLVAVVASGLGLIIVFYAKIKKTKTNHLMLVFLMTLYFISPYSHALSWIRLIGVGTHAFLKTGLTLSLYYLPLSVLLVWLGMQAIDAKYIHMAQVYRQNKTVVTHIIIKMLRPYLVTACTLIALFVLSDFSVASLFQYKTYSLEIYTTYSQGVSLKTLLYVALPLMGLMLGLALLLLKTIKRLSFKSAGQALYQHVNLSWRQGQKAFFRLVWIGVGLAYLVILARLMPLRHGLTTLVENGPVMAYSIALAAISALLTLILLLFLRKYLSVVAFQAFLLVPMVLPSGVVSVAVIKLFNGSEAYPWLVGTSILLTYANIIKVLPMMFLVFLASIETQHKGLLDSGLIYQKNTWQRLWHLEIPYFTLPLMATWLVGFASVFNDIGTTLLLIPPGKQTIALKIYSYLHYGSGDKIAALGAWVLGLFTLMSILLLGIIKSKRRFLR